VTEQRPRTPILQSYKHWRASTTRHVPEVVSSGVMHRAGNKHGGPLTRSQDPLSLAAVLHVPMVWPCAMMQSPLKLHAVYPPSAIRPHGMPSPAYAMDTQTPGDALQ
jgi:hypothetical protein